MTVLFSNDGATRNLAESSGRQEPPLPAQTRRRQRFTDRTPRGVRRNSGFVHVTWTSHAWNRRTRAGSTGPSNGGERAGAVLVSSAVKARPVPLQVVGLLVATACTKQAPESMERAESRATPAVTMSTAESLETLREGARETLDANCGECHTTGLSTALPRALRVFDLTEADWSHHMSEAQLREAARRLSEPFAPTRGEQDVRPIQASPAERVRFDRFVETELARRRSKISPAK